ncbi:MAG: hypothetical protein H7288_07145 [Kineosporiaceae bacterium]|nr:hypothetical protein [Aeromicrobium sp.]
MPQTTTLRRVLTLVVGALFAVVFMSSGASTAQAANNHGKSAVAAHTVTCKAVVRAATVAHDGVKNLAPAPAPLHLAATGPAGTDNSPAFGIDSAGETPAAHNSHTVFTTSERAPPAL